MHSVGEILRENRFVKILDLKEENLKTVDKLTKKIRKN